jgi:hypothetical protein
LLKEFANQSLRETLCEIALASALQKTIPQRRRWCLIEKTGAYDMPKIESRRFRARSDSGKEYVVIEYWEVISITPQLGFPSKKRTGRRWLRTLEGHPVNATDNPETFKIAGTDEIIRKIR